VINRVIATFPHYRKEMKGLEWGVFCSKYGASKYDLKQLEVRIVDLIEYTVSRYFGIYEYLLSGEDKKTQRVLNIRTFTPKILRAAYERQRGICPVYKKHFGIECMQADHITPWSKGGKTTTENCQMLCADCNRRKSDVQCDCRRLFLNIVYRVQLLSNYLTNDKLQA